MDDIKGMIEKYKKSEEKANSVDEAGFIAGSNDMTEIISHAELSNVDGVRLANLLNELGDMCRAADLGYGVAVQTHNNGVIMSGNMSDDGNYDPVVGLINGMLCLLETGDARLVEGVLVELSKVMSKAVPLK